MVTAVVHYNEGLHSLWPRYNTSTELQEFATNLGNLTERLKATGAKLIYATMTPFMPEKCKFTQQNVCTSPARLIDLFVRKMFL